LSTARRALVQRTRRDGFQFGASSPPELPCSSTQETPGSVRSVEKPASSPVVRDGPEHSGEALPDRTTTLPPRAYAILPRGGDGKAPVETPCSRPFPLARCRARCR